MSSSTSMGVSAVKPCCRILFSSRNSSIFGVSSSLILVNSINNRNSYGNDHCIVHIVGKKPEKIDERGDFYSSRHHALFSSSDHRNGGISVNSNVASNARNSSTQSIQPVVDNDSFERLYIQGVDVKNYKNCSSDVNSRQLDSVEGMVCKNGGRKRKVSEIEGEAWQVVRKAIVKFCGEPVGTVAGNDVGDRVFVRDFVPSAIVFLLNGEKEVVRSFLLHTLQLQSWEKTVDCYSPGQGLMPASFRVRAVPLDGKARTFDIVEPDFGDSAIGRVAPVDSGLWWIILLRAYGKITGDYSLQERVDVQTGIRLILNLCLTNGFDMFPTLLVPDGSCMIDRRMGIHGHPLEIQALFYSALRCSREMLIVNDGTENLVASINNRLSALSFHVREYYWIDKKKLNEIYRYKTEEYSINAINKFNIYPEQIPSWLVDWIPEEGGYFMGNLQPAHMDFRFFTLGNLWSIVSSLGNPKQNRSILDLIEVKWDDLISEMPLKICYPALEGEEWRIITGGDPKNTPWSCHNGGSWPTLLWQFTLACIKMGRPELAEKAITVAEKRLSLDHWPEYYDTKNGRFVGKQSRLFQTWTAAGYLTAKMLLDNPDAVSSLAWDEDHELLEKCVCTLNKGLKRQCSRAVTRSQPVYQSNSS